MIRHFYFFLAFVTAAIPLRAANWPHAGMDSHKAEVWTNDDLARLHSPGLISIVGRIDEEKPASLPARYVKTQDPEWYAEQAAKLHHELERRQAQLRGYRQALDGTRSLRETSGCIDLVGEDFATTPEAGIEILQRRVTEEQEKLDDLEGLARRNGIEPGTLRGQ